MEFAIIAAGEGSRLKKGGISNSKPMALLNGVPLIERLMRLFVANGAERILVIVNETSPDVETYLNEVRLKVPLQVIKKSTPSSLHSFHELLPHLKSDRFCLTTVDTVFEEKVFNRYISAFISEKDCDGLLAVTPFVDDESPLYVKVDESNRITAFEDLPSADARYVSGGIYCLRNTVFPTVNKAIKSGRHRMRNFQRLMIEDGLRLNAYPFDKIIDIDRKEDLAVASEWLGRIDEEKKDDRFQTKDI